MNTNLEQLYTEAKEAYYNGQPIMDDYEFDELESELGLENKSYIGSKHNPSYTIKHPFIMGSLSKVQIKRNDLGNVDFETYFNEITKYLNVSNKFKNNEFSVIATPKFDGCSFEAIINKREIVSISSRGDGEYGKDLYNHLFEHVKKTTDFLNTYYINYIIRGEVVINKSIFEKKYSDFVNPRSFVSGILNRDFCEDQDFKSMINDLSIVVYDIRENEQSIYFDKDFQNLEYPSKPTYYKEMVLTKTNFEQIYNDFSKYREICEYALDGFVIKPIESYRINNTSSIRPKDCVAVKFIPMLEETVVEDIIWSSKKTDEMIPVIKVRPVIMDGKQITKASAHNYGYLKDNRISIGTKVILSLAGDIIPYIYKVTDTTAFSLSKMNLPLGEFEGQYTVSGCHLYKQLSEVEQKQKNFKNSALSLNIPGLGESLIDKIFEYIKETYKGDEFFGVEERPIPDNILCIKDVDIERALGGKTGTNIKKEFNNLLVNITLKDIIASLSIEGCGPKVIEQIEKHLLFYSGDFTHLSSAAYEWINDYNSFEYCELMKIMNHLNKTFDDFKEIINENNKTNNIEQIPVILTGEPNNYISKGEFLKLHPEYKLTGSWKEVKIVFTNSLDSNTGKMKKAKEKNIEIRLY